MHKWWLRRKIDPEQKLTRPASLVGLGAELNKTGPGKAQDDPGQSSNLSPHR